MLPQNRRNATRMLAAIGLPILLFIASAEFASPALALTKTEKTFGSWDVICVEQDNQAKRCSMVQSRVTADKKQVVLIWSISSGDNDPKGGLKQALTVPAGVSIKEGVRLFLDATDPITLAFDVCGPRICIATAPVDAKFLDMVKASKKASASYVQMSRQLVQANLDLGGFGDAYAYLVQQLS